MKMQEIEPWLLMETYVRAYLYVDGQVNMQGWNEEGTRGAEWKGVCARAKVVYLKIGHVSNNPLKYQGAQH